MTKMTRHYVDKKQPALGYYEIVKIGEKWRWVWTEGFENDLSTDTGPWWDSEADAYLAAANDWDQNGGSFNRRLVGQLRAAATRAEKKL